MIGYWATSEAPVDPIRIPDSRRVTIGNNTYKITQVPLSSVPSSSNVHPPPHSHGPLGWNFATSQVHTAVTRPIVSQAYILSVASGGYVHTSRGHVTTFGAYIPTLEMYIPTSGAYIPTYRVSHGTSHAMTYGPYYGTPYGQGSSPYGGRYQQPAYSPNYDL